MFNRITSQNPLVVDVFGQDNISHTSGAVYWDAASRQYKIIDSVGNSTPVPMSYASIAPGHTLQKMVDWFERKQYEEQQIRELCEKYPNLADAKREYDALYNLLKNQ